MLSPEPVAFTAPGRRAQAALQLAGEWPHARTIAEVLPLQARRRTRAVLRTRAGWSKLSTLLWPAQLLATLELTASALEVLLTEVAALDDKLAATIMRPEQLSDEAAIPRCLLR